MGDLRGAYLWRQMSELDALTGGAGDKMPLLLLDDRGGARPFGEPKAELLEVGTNRGLLCLPQYSYLS